MNPRLGPWLILAASAMLIGCASVSVFKPKDGSTNVIPMEYKFKARQGASLGTSSLDGTAWQRSADAGLLFYVSAGTHVMSIDGTGSYGQSVSASSSFSVSACPLCFACPVGNVNPASGQCCDSGKCDSPAFGNFGVPFFQSAACSKPLFPGSNDTYAKNDCLSPNAVPVNGATTNAQEMAAVVFSPTVSGALTHIRVPIEATSGTNSVLVSLTDDAAGRPGTVLETITFDNVRPQVLPITTPMHVYSVMHPMLTAGIKYWLVIAPGAPDTKVFWNRSLDDVSIPAATTYMVNTTTSSLAGPWAMRSNLQELRPAFEVDVRP